jgi:hypothetical protein
MSRDLVIAPTPTSAKQYVPPRSAPVSSRNSTANTGAHNSAGDSGNSFARVRIVWGTYGVPRSRIFFRSSMRSVPLLKDCFGATPKPGRRGDRSPELATASRTHTSITPGRRQPLPASPDTRHLHGCESRRRPSNPNRTSVQHRLLVG